MEASRGARARSEVLIRCFWWYIHYGECLCVTKNHHFRAERWRRKVRCSLGLAGHNGFGLVMLMVIKVVVVMIMLVRMTVKYRCWRRQWRYSVKRALQVCRKALLECIWLFNVIVFLAGFIIVVAVVIVLQLDCMLGTSILFLALLLLFRIVVVNTKVGSDFNLSINANQRDLQGDKMWTRNQQMRFSFCVSMMFDQTCKKHIWSVFVSPNNAWHSINSNERNTHLDLFGCKV